MEMNSLLNQPGQTLKVSASCDSSKPAVISMDDYVLVENAMSIFEKTSGYSG